MRSITDRARGMRKLLGVFFLIFANATKPVAAMERNCDGYIVTDTARISLDLHRSMDTAASQYIPFALEFWDPSANQTMPDSCRIVYCADVEYTLAGRYFTIWDQKLFTDYELFNYLGDIFHRVSPSDSLQRLHPGDRKDRDYTDLWATKATIRGISKECYIQTMVLQNWGWVGLHPTSLMEQLHMRSNRRYNINGQKIEAGQIPFRPGFAPGFAPIFSR